MGYRLLTGLMSNDSPLAISVINVAEVYAGLRKGEEADELRIRFGRHCGIAMTRRYR